MKQILKTVIEKLNAAQIRYKVIGGIAIGYHIAPRTTSDIDILIQEKDLPKVQAIFGNGTPMDNGYAFDVSGIDVEFLFSVEDDEEFLYEKTHHSIPVPNIYSMIYLKLKGLRAKDSADIIEIVKTMNDEQIKGFKRFVKQNHLPSDMVDDFNSLAQIAKMEMSGRAKKKASFDGFVDRLLSKYGV